VDTILHFAREYRVGHIVVGRPGPLPAWKRWLGRKTIVERLIVKARGLTIVVVDPKAETEKTGASSLQQRPS
jgi:two-component system sensor histidine kinase KdpD